MLALKIHPFGLEDELTVMILEAYGRRGAEGIEGADEVTHGIGAEHILA